MEPIKYRILAVLNQYGQGPEKIVSLSMLDRHMVVVQKEREYIGSRLITVIQELIAEGILLPEEGTRIGLTSVGQQVAEKLSSSS